METTKVKSTIKTRIVKLISVLLTILTLVLIVFFIFNIFLGENAIHDFFLEWADTNKTLTIVLFLVLSPIINLIPGISSMFFITLANLLFNNRTWIGMGIAFSLCAASITLTSSLMFLIGRIGGKRIVEWILGREASENTMKLLTTGGKAALPAFYLLPFFPDDSLALIAGMTNMSFLYNFFCTLIFRNIGALVICIFGTNIIDFSLLTWWMWLSAILAFLLVALFFAFLSYKYYLYLRRKEEGVSFYLTYKLKPKDKKSEGDGF